MTSMRLRTLLRQAHWRKDLVHFASALGPTTLALFLQFVTFAVTARGLGVEAFGEYAAVLAITGIGGEIVGVGSSDVLVRAVSRDRSLFQAYFGSMLWLIAMTLPVAAGVGFCAMTFVVATHIDSWHVLGALVGEMTLGRVSASTELIMVAHSDTFKASCVRLATVVARLAVTVAFFALSSGLPGWIELILLESLLLAGLYIVLVAKLYGAPRSTLITSELGLAATFCVNQTARAAQSNIDRVVLSHYANGAALGVYSAGSRFVQLGLFPVQVVMRILYPRFFIHGAHGMAATRRFALKCVPALLAVGTGSGIAVAAAGVLAPRILGPSFAETTDAVVKMAIAIPLMAIQYPAADALTGGGDQRLRTMIYSIAALGTGLLLAAGAHFAGVSGVIACFVGGQLLLAAVLWIGVFLRD
jgi:O-antigen/teichoic acid export membrane protein